MNHSTLKEHELAFYVVSNRNPDHDGEIVTAHYGLTLPNAITIYNGYGNEMYSVLGVTRDGVETDLVHRIDEESVLVSDYQEMDEWKHNPYLCISAVSLLLANLNIERQMDARCMTRPFEERLHVMRLKNTEELRPCYMKSRDAMKRLGVEPTMDKYDLIYSEAVRPGESMVDVCKRYHLNVPTGFHGYAPSVSDVLVLQTRRGCHALIIDSLGFEVVERFVRPPGWRKPEDLMQDTIYAPKGEDR